ncbi:MAG: 16S rRNA (uracil(1498)-N(3))-methyltransferase [Hyphomicrobiales bacterium]|nr:16S rRNA (uracil(1498)-N(3))-methyltransferase [Hyphomicrobiales bacterium]
MSRYDFDKPRLYVSERLAAGGRVALEKDQANYLRNVLRLGDGAEILVFNGQDGEWLASLNTEGRKSAWLELSRHVRPQPLPSRLDYLFAPLKHARLDYMVQKAVEMGAGRLSPILTRRTQVSRVNLDRMRANAIEAAEQCGILCIPEVREPQSLPALLESWPADCPLIFCDEDAPAADPVAVLRATLGGKDETRSLAVLIGPEGGFAPEERQMLISMQQAVTISLGPRILRADTAAVAALAVVQAAVGDW